MSWNHDLLLGAIIKTNGIGVFSTDTADFKSSCWSLIGKAPVRFMIDNMIELSQIGKRVMSGGSYGLHLS